MNVSSMPFNAQIPIHAQEAERDRNNLLLRIISCMPADPLIAYELDNDVAACDVDAWKPMPRLRWPSHVVW